jgi:hypothetical protein
MGTETQHRRRSSSSGTGGTRWTGSDWRRPLQRPIARALCRPTPSSSAAMVGSSRRTWRWIRHLGHRIRLRRDWIRVMLGSSPRGGREPPSQRREGESSGAAREGGSSRRRRPGKGHNEQAAAASASARADLRGPLLAPRARLDIKLRDRGGMGKEGGGQDGRDGGRQGPATAEDGTPAGGRQRLGVE